jgi:hypothetical protein
MKLTRENRSTRRKTCPSATLSTTNPTWTDPGSNPGLRLSHGTDLRTLVEWRVAAGCSDGPEYTKMSQHRRITFSSFRLLIRCSIIYPVRSDDKTNVSVL